MAFDKKNEFFSAVAAHQKEIGVDKWRAERLKCQTDLWYLCSDIFGLDLHEKTHRPVIDFFLKKKPFDTNRDYRLADVHKAIGELAPMEKRRGILLYPRGSFKSSISAINTVQTILCFPDCRILILTAESTLGEAFVPSIKERFVLRKNAKPTRFQLLFPEFVVDESQTNANVGGEGEYWCPARKIKQVEPTLGSLSIMGSTSGWHCDFLDCDDVISDTSGLTPTTRQKVIKKFVTVINMLDPHGVLELIGTRYHIDDLYAHAAKHMPKCRKLVGASWTVLPHAKQKKALDLLASDVVLLFPERQGFKYLREKLLLDEETFFLQQLNDPQRTGPVVTFTEQDIRSITMQLPMPVGGEEIYNLWDFAYGDTRSNDYCVGVFVSINRAYQAHVHALVAEKFTPSELARQLVLMAHRTRPKAVMYEHIVGSDFLEMEARKLATELGYEIPLSPFKTDKGPNAKAVRIAALEPLLKGGRLFFSNTLQNYDLLMKQFTDFTGERSNKKHDDIPDAISFIRRILPMTGLELPTHNTPVINGTQLTQNIFTFEQNATPMRDFNFDTFMRQQGQPQAPPVVAKPKRDGQPTYGLDFLN